MKKEFLGISGFFTQVLPKKKPSQRGPGSFDEEESEEDFPGDVPQVEG